MHPNTRPTLNALGLSMLILGILLLPLPLVAYKVLKFLLSLSLLYAAPFFLRSCKNLSFQPSADEMESGSRDPIDGTFTGELRNRRTNKKEALTEENSQIIAFLEETRERGKSPLLPPISLPMALGLLLVAVGMNPLTGVHLPREAWMVVDVLALGLLGYTWHLIQRENDGEGECASLTGSVGQPPEFREISFIDAAKRIRTLWPVLVGGAFVLALLGTQIGEGEFKDINGGDLIYKPIAALLGTALLTFGIMSATENLVSKGCEKNHAVKQVSGVYFIALALLIYLSFVFGGFFTPKPPRENRRNDTERYDY